MLYVVIANDRAVLTNAASGNEARHQAVRHLELDEEETEQLRLLPLPVLPDAGQSVTLDVRF